MVVAVEDGCACAVPSCVESVSTHLVIHSLWIQVGVVPPSRSRAFGALGFVNGPSRASREPTGLVKGVKGRLGVIGAVDAEDEGVCH